MSNETQSMPSPGTYFATNNGDQLAASIALANLTKDTYNPVDSITANGVNDLRRDVAKSEADIKTLIATGDLGIISKLGDDSCRIIKAVGDAACLNTKDIGDTRSALIKAVGDAQCDINKSVHDSECTVIDRMGTYASDNFRNQSDIAQRQAAALNAVERDLQNRIHENRFVLTKEIGDKTERVSDLMSRDFVDVKNQLRHFETATAKSLCELETQGLKNTSKILETMAANKYDALKDEVDEIRAARYADRYNHGFALQSQDINYLKQMINSVEQTQKFSSKTVQFGAGNVALPTQTANQG